MRRTILRAKRWLRAFIHDTHAVAAVEFALILPPLLLLYLGAIEGSSLITIDRRVQIVSGTIGDLVARWDPGAGAIPSSTLADYLRASRSIMYPYETTSMRQRISMVKVFDNDKSRVVWSCGYNGEAAYRANSLYDLPINTRNLADGANDIIIVSEIFYPHTPLLGLVFEDVYNIYSRSFYLPRFGPDIAANC